MVSLVLKIMSIDLSSIKKFENLELLAKELVEGFITGLHRSPYHGFSVEFADHKHYNFGESTRNIDWKVFAKTDQLYIKQYEEETNLRCTIVLDISKSMYYPKPNFDKIKFSICAAAAISYLMISQRDAVGLIGFAEKISLITPQKSTKYHLNQLLIQLSKWMDEQLTHDLGSDISQSLHLIADKINKRSLVMIFTDMFQGNESMESIFTALQHLKHNKHEVLLFHVSDQHTERDFNFDDRPYVFKDSETGKKIKVSPSFMKASYRQKMNDFYTNMRLACGQLKIDFIEVNTTDPFDKVLSSYLVKRKKMN